MGGFEGGDEGGFWDIDPLPVSINKGSALSPNGVNKKKFDIERDDDRYSIKVHPKELYNAISFIPCKCETFTIEGYDTTPVESTTIFKAFIVLTNATGDTDIVEFFYTHKVVVTKCIPDSTDLERSACDTGSFIYLLKEVLNLVLTTDELLSIGNLVDADVALFIKSIT